MAPIDAILKPKSLNPFTGMSEKTLVNNMEGATSTGAAKSHVSVTTAHTLSCVSERITIAFLS